MADLTTFGETMLRLSTPPGERLETATELECRTAGAESNVAIAAANLGTDAAWLSKLPENPLGRRVVRDLRAHGVEPVVAWAAEADSRQGTYYIEVGGEPRGTNVVYDRAGSAVTTATPGDLALDQVRDADYFCTCGITPALSATLRDTTEALLETARGAGTRTVLDVNYRSALWSPAEARRTLEALLPSVDVIVTAERDARTVLGFDGEAAAMATELLETFGAELVLVTRGADGVVAADGETVYRQPAYPAETVDPVGTGDAFLGGFLASRIAGEPLDDALDRAAATAALARTLAGDSAVVSWDDVEAVRDHDAGISR